MSEPSKTIRWEQFSATWWSSSLGYVVQEDGVWTAHAYRNQRSGTAWTETKRGFRTWVSARQWVELTADS